jgi:glycosyltransferase involved in cell wall biosynthesis
MNILIVNKGIIPVTYYGGVERIAWTLGKELVKLGHKVIFLANKGSSCDFAPVLHIDWERNISEQIPDSIDLIHFNYSPPDFDLITKPYVITIHGNRMDHRKFSKNSIFVSKNHANRYGSNTYVYNGLDWNDYDAPTFSIPRNYFHFLGKAAWRVKNVKGAIEVIKRTKSEKLRILGGTRLNIKMGFRFTLSPRARFHGNVGGAKKFKLINRSKGLIYPVKWHEPFGLAIIESLFYGCPVFGTTHGSLPELVKPEVGFLSNNAITLANAVENSGEFSMQLCHDYAVEHFNARNMAKSYLVMYDKVLNGETLNVDFPNLKTVKIEKYLDWTI